MKGIRLSCVALCLCALLLLPSCGGGGGSGSVSSGDTGTLSLSLTDATTLDYQAVYVTIDRVDIHLGGNENSSNNWETVAEPKATYNLLELVNGVLEHLGITTLPAGKYTQMRLIIGRTQDDSLNIFGTQHPFANYVILAGSGDIYELKVPSGSQTGIKLVHGFTIKQDQTKELILDFDAAKSVVKAGASGRWLLKPTIKVVDTDDLAIISGTVYEKVYEGEDDVDGVLASVAGVLVSAQTNDTEATDRKDQVVTWTSTVTDANGQYKLFLEPGSYNIVVYGTDYYPTVECSVAVVSGQVAEGNDFVLTLAPTGTVSGDVIITGDQYATISFRQFWDCDGTIIEIEVKSINTNADFTETLSEGIYDVVASSYDKTTVDFENVVVPENDDVDLGSIVM